MNLLKIIGTQITKLDLHTDEQHEFDQNILHELCPELVSLKIKSQHLNVNILYLTFY